MNKYTNESSLSNFNSAYLLQGKKLSQTFKKRKDGCEVVEDEMDSRTVFSWEQVSTIHKTRNGIYQRNGRLISLLTDFGRINPCYPDRHGETTDLIIYTGNGRRRDQKLDAQNRAMLDAIPTKITVPLFNKLAPGRWEFLGNWQITNGKYIYDESQQRNVWKFTLEKAEN